MKNSLRRVLALMTLALSLTASFAIPASANHAWGNYHWARTANPFTVKLGSNLGNGWKSYLSGAASDWSQSTVLDAKSAAGASSPATCPPTAGRVEVCNAAYGSTGWLGVASIWTTTGSHITQGTVKINDTYFNTAQYNTPAWKNLVMCQEVGHTFGLDHQDTNFNNANLNTCMDYTNLPDSNQHPNQHDYDELVTIYSHLDSFTTVQGGSGGTIAQGNFNTPDTWGRLVAASADGRTSTYVRDFGGGVQMVTHVFWAE